MIQFLYEDDYKKLFFNELKNLSKSAMVLNIACENELIPDFLRGKISDEGFFGMEINKDIVKRNDHIVFCNVDENRFPYDDNSFDAVISIWGMEHFQKENLFFETMRVLKSGGIFVFLTPNASNPAFLMNKLGGSWLGKWYYKKLLNDRYVPHRAYYAFNTAQRIKKVGAKTGFEVSQMLYFGPSNFLEYFTFSRVIQKIVAISEKCITNRFLYFLKPYLLVTIRKK